MAQYIKEKDSTWTKIGGVEKHPDDIVGEIKTYAGIIDDTHPTPTGWLLCDGSEVSKATYSSLYAVIGDKYGVAGDTSNFKLPDYRECVLVGAGENKTLEIASHDVYELGQFKDDQLQGHWHRVFDAGYSSGGGGANGWSTGYQGAIKDATTIKSDGVNGTPRIGTTTHGKQIGVNYLIRY